MNVLNTLKRILQFTLLTLAVGLPIAAWAQAPASVGSPMLESDLVTNDSQLPQAYVSAQVNPNNLPTTVIIQFGTNTSYGMAVTNTLTATNAYQSLSQTFAYPSINVTTTLHALITASNSAGTTSSGDLTCSSLLFEKTYSSDFGAETAKYLSPVTGSAAWADLDNDGWLDLACDGQSSYLVCQGYIYYNPGTNQTQTSIYAPLWDTDIYLPNGNRAGMAVGDFDNDNRPDLFFACGPGLAGLQNSLAPISDSYMEGLSGIMYGQNARYANYFGTLTNGSFVTNLLVQDASVAVGDFDHSGRQDVLVSGSFFYSNSVYASGPGPFSMLLQNNLAGGRNINNTIDDRVSTNPAMLSVNTSIPYLGGDVAGLWSSGQAVLAAGDFDNDGFPDLFALNFFIDSTGAQYAGFFHNDSNKNFTPTSRFPLFPGVGRPDSSFVETASCVLADMNGDGNLDMVLSYVNQEGTPDGITTVSIWLNDGHGNLTNSNIVLPQLQLANLAVGDIFNHGRNDILMVGTVSPSVNVIQTVVLRNDGGGVFTPIVLGNFGSIGETGHGLQLADYDNDGRLDFAMTGDTEPVSGDQFAGFDPGTYIFRNEMNIPSNAPPAAPPNLSTTVGNGTVTFHWGNATDDITPASLLTYNLRVGTNSLDTSVVSPLANVTNGWRKIAAPGNCGHTTNTLYRFPPGTYYWSVQAVDGGFKGGAWAPEQTFTITNPEPAVLALNQPVNQPYMGPGNIPYIAQELTLLNASSNLVNVTSNTLNLSWPTRLKGWTVKQSPSLVNPVWTTNTNVGTLNGNWSLLVTNTGTTNMFFRLVQ